MLDPSEWNESELLQLIADQVTESVSLDYKESAALQKTDGKKTELSKDVSAFANSAGGVLIYGIQEDGHVPVALDNGLDPSDISKEWVEQVINSRIERRIDGIRIRQVALSGTRSGRVAYVVVVPASTRAPHMASDHRYYKRFNFESVPMEDYEVRDVSRRLVAPDMRLGLELVAGTGEMLVEPAFRVYLENRAASAASFALVTLHVSASCSPSASGLGTGVNNHVILSGSRIPVHSYKLEWRGGLRLPLMRGARYHVTNLSVSLTDSASTARIFWEIFAPEADPKTGAVSLRWGQNGSLIVDHAECDWHLAQQPIWSI